jgi:hypothetical protein
LPPQSLGTEKKRFDEEMTPNVEQYQQRYPKEDIKMFRP